MHYLIEFFGRVAKPLQSVFGCLMLYTFWRYLRVADPNNLTSEQVDELGRMFYLMGMVILCGDLRSAREGSIPEWGAYLCYLGGTAALALPIAITIRSVFIGTMQTSIGSLLPLYEGIVLVAIALILHGKGALD